MNILQSFIITLSMYTSIPVPIVEWNEKNLKYCLAFLPVPGILIGLAQSLFFALSAWLGFSAALYAAGFCVITALITGCIHVDGLADTFDALGSHGTKEKKMQILDDPRTGAFGVAGAILYFIALYGAVSEIYSRITTKTPEEMFCGTAGSLQEMTAAAAAVFFGVFAVSRAMTALHIAGMEPSKKSGLLYTFSSVSSVAALRISAVIVTIAGFAAVFQVFSFASLIPATGVCIFSAYFRRMAKLGFGGISGDLCGWYIQMQELILLLCFLAALLVS